MEKHTVVMAHLSPDAACPHPLDHLASVRHNLSAAITFALHTEAASGRFEAAGLTETTMNQFLDQLFFSLDVQLNLHFGCLMGTHTPPPR